MTATSMATPDAPITYRSWRQTTQDNVDARVWSGIHSRSTDEVTRGYGTEIATAPLPRLGGEGRR